MTSKFTAIYVRRSVSDKEKGNNSLSIAAQREECIRYVGEEANFKVYCDDGKSGKDVRHRPEFMQMMSDAKDGYIDRIIVKKYDRFSRNMREYLNITDELDRYGVGVVSLSEPFNTETKEGRMMRNNLLNFAEFERETIAARVKDAYSTKAEFRKEYEALAPEYELAKMLIACRNADNLTQKQLSELTGIDQADISKIENGNANPSIKTLTRIASAMNMNLKIEFVPKTQNA